MQSAVLSVGAVTFVVSLNLFLPEKKFLWM